MFKRVYLAGPMKGGGEAGGESYRGYAHWRDEMQRRDPKTHWLNPKAVGCDHNGISAYDTVGADFDLIRSADAVVAYLDSIHRWGTITEIGYAVGRSIPVFVAVEEQAHRATTKDSIEQLGETGWLGVITKSGHECDCMTDRELQGWLWFPLAAATKFKIVNGEPEAISTMLHMLQTHRQVVRNG